MKVLKYLLYFILAIVALVLAAGLFAKKNYHIERSVVINAPHSFVKEKVANFAHFAKWSPWQKLDPNMITKIDGTDGTVGATYSWKGNKDVGSGSQVFKSITDNRVDIDVKFTEPWESTAPSYITMDQTPEGVKTTWGFDMTMPFPMNAFAMLTDIDKGVGKDYAIGLENLKALCEGEAKKMDSAVAGIKIENVPVQQYVGFKQKMPMSEISSFCQKSYTALMGGLAPEMIAGKPTGLYFVWDEANGSTEMAAVVPVKGKITQLADGKALETFTVGGNAAVLDFTGSYEDSKFAHMAMDKYLAAKGLTPKLPIQEVYLNDPEEVKDPNQLQTRVIYYFNEPVPVQ